MGVCDIGLSSDVILFSRLTPSVIDALRIDDNRTASMCQRLWQIHEGNPYVFQPYYYWPWPYPSPLHDVFTRYIKQLLECPLWCDLNGSLMIKENIVFNQVHPDHLNIPDQPVVIEGCHPLIPILVCASYLSIIF